MLAGPPESPKGVEFPKNSFRFDFTRVSPLPSARPSLGLSLALDLAAGGKSAFGNGILIRARLCAATLLVSPRAAPTDFRWGASDGLVAAQFAGNFAAGASPPTAARRRLPRDVAGIAARLLERRLVLSGETVPLPSLGTMANGASVSCSTT
jgi:hypothetical protein